MEAMSEFQLLRPTTLAGVLEARAAHPGSQLLGGGTDLIVNVRRGIVAPPVLIDMNGVAELRTIEADAQGLDDRRVGDAGRGWQRTPACWSTIPSWRRRRAPSPGRPIATWAPSAATCASTRAASSTIRANGGGQANNHCLKTTGDICHVAPKSRGVCFATFSGDLAPALLTLGAEVDLVGPDGPAHAAAAGPLHRPCPPRRLGRGRRQALPEPAAGRAGRRRAGEVRSRPALGLRQDPHPPLDRVSGGGRGRGAAPRGRDAGRSARRHHRHQPAASAARRHAGAVRRRDSTSACSTASTSWCATRSCR